MDECTSSLRVADVVSANARDLDRDLAWLGDVLDARLSAHFRPENATRDPLSIPPPRLDASDSPYARLLRDLDVAPEDRLVVLLALVPHVRPQMLDILYTRNEATARGFSEFGGVASTQHGGFLPTGQTAVFLLAGDSLELRFHAMQLFDGAHVLAKQNIVRVGPAVPGEPMLSGLLNISPEFLQRVTTGVESRPIFGSEFPARLVETSLTWEDLVLPQSALDQLDEIRRWMAHGPALLHEWEMGDRLRPNYTSLFYGPPGCGKTLAASLLGKLCGDCEVFKVDLSLIASRYVGDAEKALARVFDAAEHRRWLLFFDEADAIFGKRTRVDDSHDRYANQEVSYLLQRIEDFDGVVVLASNLKHNIDDAFLRRFQSMVHFPMPRAPERLRMWTRAFPRKATLDEGIDLRRIAERHELSGGTIMNVARFASLMALSRGEDRIQLDDLEDGIRRECLKEGRPN
jgi:hypothetical protein